MATVYLVMLCVYVASIEGGSGISNVKVALMGAAPVVLVWCVPLLSRALCCGLAFWLLCWFSASLAGDVRFSTLGFLGMYVGAFIVYYNLLLRRAFSYDYFRHLLRWLILAFGIVLVGQQVCVLAGVRNMPLLNLDNQFFLSITKLPSLTLEPSHSARVLVVLFLSWLRLEELGRGARLTVAQLFGKEHRAVSGLFLWTMLTMGSGTAFVALGLLSLYFVRGRQLAYSLPLLVGLFYIGQAMEMEQMSRAVRMSEVVLNGGDAADVIAADGSGAYRVLPLLNTVQHLDLTDQATWLGHGTAKKKGIVTLKEVGGLGTIDQYGLVAYIVSLLLVYMCAVRHVLSLETLLLVVLFGASLGNVYYTWGCLMVMAGVRYFQERPQRCQGVPYNQKHNNDNGN